MKNDNKNINPQGEKWITLTNEIPVIDMWDEYFPQLCLAYKRELLMQHQQGPVVVDQRPGNNNS